MTEMSDSEQLKKKLDKLEKIVKKWNRKLISIRASRKFYLRKRMPMRLKYEGAMKKAIRVLKTFQDVVGRTRLKLNHGASGGMPNVLFMCNENQARKLRMLVDEDLRKNHAWKVLHHKNGGTK